MSRYIDADALLRELDELQKPHDIGFGEETILISIDLESLYKFINDLPTADVFKVVHGKWIRKGDEIYCSECKFRFYPVMFKYCPGCGAKMEVTE